MRPFKIENGIGYTQDVFGRWQMAMDHEYVAEIQRLTAERDASDRALLACNASNGWPGWNAREALEAAQRRAADAKPTVHPSQFLGGEGQWVCECGTANHELRRKCRSCRARAASTGGE